MVTRRNILAYRSSSSQHLPRHIECVQWFVVGSVPVYSCGGSVSVGLTSCIVSHVKQTSSPTQTLGEKSRASIPLDTAMSNNSSTNTAALMRRTQNGQLLEPDSLLSSKKIPIRCKPHGYVHRRLSQQLGAVMTGEVKLKNTTSCLPPWPTLLRSA